MNILCLDGGGSKGVYTIGILKEFEAKIDKPLHEFFDFIYGTSTGAIITALIGLGKSIDEVDKLYFNLIPDIMSQSSAKGKSRKLLEKCNHVFEVQDFTAFKTGVGIVAMNYDTEKPLIFKSSDKQAYKLKSTFIPGFGCTITDAVIASSAAYPIFQKALVQTKNQGNITAIDGGFIANNPILIAITDATKSLECSLDDLRILSLGTGKFVEKVVGFKSKFFNSLKFVQLFEKMLLANSKTTEILVNLLYPNLKMVRINEAYNQPDYGTNMVENDIEKLKLIRTLGRDSFGKYEDEIDSLFNFQTQ